MEGGREKRTSNGAGEEDLVNDGHTLERRERCTEEKMCTSDVWQRLKSILLGLSPALQTTIQQHAHDEQPPRPGCAKYPSTQPLSQPQTLPCESPPAPSSFLSVLLSCCAPSLIDRLKKKALRCRDGEGVRSGASGPVFCEI